MLLRLNIKSWNKILRKNVKGIVYDKNNTILQKIVYNSRLKSNE